MNIRAKEYNQTLKKQNNILSNCVRINIIKYWIGSQLLIDSDSDKEILIDIIRRYKIEDEKGLNILIKVMDLSPYNIWIGLEPSNAYKGSYRTYICDNNCDNCSIKSSCSSYSASHITIKELIDKSRA
jgi:hypothetical protein